MGRIEKTVFICYRRADLPWALAVYKDLTSHGYDVFFDFMSINSGDFEDVIIGNIKARAHFLIVLTPSSLERCINPEDWVRREIDCALKTKRNIVPLMFENFDFNDPSVTKSLSGSLSVLHRYNGLRMPSEYFDEAMVRLRDRFLNIPLQAVLKPLSSEVENATREQKDAAESAIAKLVSSPLIRDDTISLQTQQSGSTLPQQDIGPVTPQGPRIGVTYSVETPVGKANVTINENAHHQPIEVFINTAKAGSETAAVSEAMGRLVSIILRVSESVEPLDRIRFVVRELMGIGSGRSLGIGPNRVRSLPDGIGQVFDVYLRSKASVEDGTKDENKN